jgi:hypothetical protein
LNERKQSREAPDRNDGIRTIPREGDRTRQLAIAAAVAAVAVSGLLLFGGSRSGTTDDEHRAASAAGEDNRPVDYSKIDRNDIRAIPLRPRSEAARAAKERYERAAAAAGEGEAEIDAGDYIAALRAEGETGGLAAFNPPGTRPPQSGVVVPDDYELPEGYARHYQATDGGTQLRPVLTLSPNYELVDGDGKNIPLGMDRIVPPELAPPDLPVEILDLPNSDGGN